MFLQTVYAQVQDWGSCVVDGVPPLKCLEVVVSNIVFVTTTFALLILLIMLIIGAFRFIVSGGNQDKLKIAKGTITSAFIGLALFLGAYLLLNIIDILFLGGKGVLFRFEVPEM